MALYVSWGGGGASTVLSGGEGEEIHSLQQEVNGSCYSGDADRPPVTPHCATGVSIPCTPGGGVRHLVSRGEEGPAGEEASPGLYEANVR